MNKILHKIAHLFGCNYGTPYSFYDNKGRLLMGFKCSGCGKLSGVHCIDEYVDEILRQSIKQ